MGPNYVDFLVEAWRVLHVGGILKIAEVESRFIRVADARSLDSGIVAFTNTLQRVGFKRTSCNRSNNFFVLFEFEKVAAAEPSDGNGKKKKKKKKWKREEMFALKACRYKKR